jgi:hypothetical protein
MQPPRVEWAIPVSPDEREARTNEGWRVANVTVRRPVEGSVDAEAVRLEQRASEGLGPRRVLIPARYVRALRVTQSDQSGAVAGIVLGAVAVAAGLVALVVLAQGVDFGG